MNYRQFIAVLKVVLVVGSRAATTREPSASHRVDSTFSQNVRMAIVIGTPMKAPNTPHRYDQKKTEKSTSVGDIESAVPENSRFNITADRNLYHIQKNEEEYGGLPGLEFGEGISVAKSVTSNGPRNGNVVQDEANTPLSLASGSPTV